MTAKLTDTEKIRRLPWLWRFNALNGIFCTLTVLGSAFPLFLNELGLDKTRIGLLLSLIPFCGLIALFIAPTVARFGVKRTALLFYATRKFVIGLLLLTPFIISRFGHPAALRWIGGVILVFALCRAIAETAIYPWDQEIIPNYVRGKYSGISSVISTLTQIAAVAFVGYVIGRFAGLDKYMFLIAGGVIAGIASVICLSFAPGGKPVNPVLRKGINFRKALEPLTDINFTLFLAGLALVTLGTAFFAFIPLFMTEEVGLTLRKTVLLGISTAAGVMFFGYFWGWAADRYGSKPIMLSGLGLMLLGPLGYILLPRHHAYSNLLAGTIAFILGAAGAGWGVGSGRYLNVSAVPTDRKSSYMAVFYASAGLVGGISPLLAGRFLDYCRGISGRFLIFNIDSYVPLFIICFLLLVIGMIFLTRIRSEGALPTREFLGMFIRGNPFMALEALMFPGFRRTEPARISAVKLLGHSRNPLGSNEIIQALHDPSFNIRYEAVLSAAGMPLNPALLNALITVLRGKEPSLSITAAWALGKTNNPQAILALRETLPSKYRTLKAQCARSLAILGDTASIPVLHKLLREEIDENTRVALVSALGTLKVTEVADELLLLLKKTTSPVYRSELSFALAHLVGEEERFIRMWRRSQPNIAMVTVQTMPGLLKRLQKIYPDETIEKLGRACIEEFIRENIREGSRLLSELLDKIPAERWNNNSRKITGEIIPSLVELGGTRPEYILLALHLLYVNLKKPV